MHVAPQPSHIAQRVLLSSHILSLAVLWMTHGTLAVQLLFSLLILLSLLQHRAILLRHPSPAFTLEADQTITLVTPSGETQSSIVATGTTVTPYFVLLRLKTETQRRPINFPIFYDALPTDVFRQLRIWLKYAT
ncbi:MAG: protein YgfX [Gallionella sp.]